MQHFSFSSIYVIMRVYDNVRLIYTPKSTNTDLFTHLNRQTRTYLHT